MLAHLPKDAPALSGPDGFSLSGSELSAHLEMLWSTLQKLPQGTRVATLLPDAPFTAISLLVMVHHLQVMPLNPALKDDELTAILKDGSAQALLSATGDTRAAALARQLDLPLAGLDDAGQIAVPDIFCPSDSPALILHTSGSTGTPKRVPLSPDQLHRSADRIARALKLGPDDCAVHALPMFHIGAIVDLLLAPLSAGGAVRFAGGMGAQDLRTAVQDGGNWVQLVPTMLARLKAELTAQEAVTFGQSLRFIRSVSSDLAPHVQAEAEAFFAGTPIIQMFGMTETAGQITTNPLPPKARKFGSVGQAFEVDVRIEGDEVQVRGDSVTAGYEGTERAAHFTADGWLRTGDLGYLDDDGFLFLTGRAKEMINRGGEKISPYEVERTALTNPDVVEAAAFALAHPTLGEEVGLAVTLKQGCTLDGLRETLSSSLADFKQPRRILVQDPLPRLGSGKIDRRALATLQAPKQTASKEGTLTGLAAQIAKAWRSVLPDQPASADIDFFDAGGDSLSGAQFLFEVEKLTGRSLPQNLLYDAPIFADFVAAVEQAPLRQIADRSDAKHVFLQSRLAKWDAGDVPGVPFMRVLGSHASGTPLFWCAQEEGEYQKISEAFCEERPLYLMRSLFLMLGKNDEMNNALAADYAAAIAQLQPEGDIVLGGFCEGAKIMRFAAAHLRSLGRDVRVLISWDQWFDAPDPVPVLHLWSDDRYNRYRTTHLFPERAIASAHPEGYRAIRVGGGHTEVLTQGPLEPFLEALNSALRGEALQGAPRGTAVFDAPLSGALKVSSPRFFTRGGTLEAQVTLSSDTPNLPATPQAPLYLAARVVNLDGYVTDAVAGLVELHAPLTSQGSPTSISVQMPASPLPVRIEVTLYDSASNAAQFAHKGAAQRTVLPKLFG